jgi:pimeloyl-ACP methyl ester carboxylesterase
MRWTRMHSISSADGTPIRYFRRGHGPAILLVHGTAADHGRWAPVLPGLQRHFTVYAMDRRGRGGSGDAANYRMEDEYADVAAVLAAIEPGPVDVVGHSYGGICAMEAVFRNAGIRRLVLYEPPIAVLGASDRASQAIAAVRRLIAQGERGKALEFFYGQIAKIPPRALTAMRALPDWSKQVRAVHTVLRELEAMAAYALDPQRFRAWNIPTLLLLGGDSPPVYRAGIERMQAILPGSTIAVLEGQGHMAMRTAPKLFVQRVVEFLKEA